MSKAVGLYIHVPFCRRKCPYCDFYSKPFDSTAAERWKYAVIRELKRQSVSFDTVYFGGGTPSLLTAGQIYDILSAADILPEAEISAEANPDSADISKLCDLRFAGINRLSVGVQSLDDRELAAIGRLHSAQEAVCALENARKAGFENISADIMLGIPYQTQESMLCTIRRICGLEAAHISAYMLKTEKGTPFAADHKLQGECADDDALAQYYLSAVSELSRLGYAQYEISNFSKAGFECRHNLKYWRCEEYIGIGPAAHSCFAGKRYYTAPDTEKFIDGSGDIIITDSAPCTAEEKLMLALRLAEGFDASLAGSSKGRLLSGAAALEKHGLLSLNGSVISLTAKGFLVSNEIICRLSQEL